MNVRLVLPRRLGTLLGIGILLAGCASPPSPQARTDAATALAARAGWKAADFPGRHFDLAGFVPAGVASTTGAARKATTVTIYFEGDGLAWRGPDAPSDDPTPVHPVGLELALAHPGQAAAYIARPCQFGSAAQASCDQRYWTDARYAPEVVEDMDHAVDLAKWRAGASRVVLVGYSGGGALAALVAARRHDVARLVTVAANVDVAEWTRVERLRPLSGSLDPADFTASLSAVPQVHFVGSDDIVVPPAIAHAFASRLPNSAPVRVIEMKGFDHGCCWVQHWPELIGPWLPQ
jgi:pimeloyl-ACP methyl ester carboxylesterase